MSSSPLAKAFSLLTLIAGMGLAVWWCLGWIQTSPMVEPQGGMWFPKTVLHDVPHFAQADQEWAADPLGNTRGTLRAEGCAVTSAAMVLASYGVDLDPGRLNQFLRTHQGYTEQGWIYWEKASAYPPVVAQHIYEDDASHFLIDWNLLWGNPVIVRLRSSTGITHFVVIVGKTGYEYLVRDPGHGYGKGLYYLSEFGSSIEALRFYEKLTFSTEES
tara:strand:- start:562 stop:1209 length:648 start_codon:yes stop_codon:yes gene_type:complete